MSRHRRAKKISRSVPARPTVFSERGFTIVELLIAMFIAGIIATAIYSVYTNFFRQSTVQEMTLEAQQNARVAINMMERELMNAGYSAGTADIITEATANSVEFIYTDPENDPAMSATAGKRLKTKYWLQTVGGVQYLVKKTDNLSDSILGATEKVIPNVQNLNLTYYDVGGTTLADTTTQANRNNIRFISVQVVTETTDNVPGTAAKKTYMVETHIRLRNIGIGQTALDTTAPSAPTGLQVRDIGQCSRLKAKWNLNPEGDISGYKIYYGTSSGSYTGVLNIPLTILSGTTYSCTKTSSSMECTIYPTTPPLDYTASNAASSTTYFVALKAYDNSLNHSAYSSEVSGDPTPSNSVFGSGSDDTTINPVKLPAVTGLAGADGASDNTVALSWSAYDTSANPDVEGFRIYRSTSPFSSYPIDPSDPNVDWIAGEPGSGKPEVAPTDVSFTDPGPGLLGCKVYYYAIAPVSCDATLVTDEGGDPTSKKYVQTDYDATCGDGSTACSAGSGFSAVAGSDTAPAETTAPLAPGGFGARAGWKRVAVSFTQPTDPDLKFTCIYSQEGSTYPTLQSTVDAIGCYDVQTPGIRLYESQGQWTTSELAIGQSTSFWHNSMTSLSSVPSLLDTGTYSYRAVSFDLCGNASPVTAAQATTTLCGEDPTGKPPAPSALSAQACSSPATLTWTAVPSDISQPSSPTNPWDLAGYRIMRSTSATDWTGSTLLNPAAPLWGTSFSDTTLTDGGTYYYRVISTDCPYEKVNPTEAVIRANMNSGTLNYIQTGPVNPGMLDRDEKCPGAGACTKDDHREVLTGVDIDDSSGAGTGASTPSSGLTHDTVTIFFNNTSLGTMTITGASVAWVDTSAKLSSITIGGGRSGVGQTSTSFTAGQTTFITSNPPYTATVSGATLTPATIAGSARYVPITFKFADSGGSPVDMRDDQLLITLDVTNDSTGSSTCTSHLTISMASSGIAVPFGPSITAAQQDQPTTPTFSFAVPGSTGLNSVPSGSDGSIVVDSAVSVKVSAIIAGNTTDASTGTKVPVSSATLYYKATAKTVTTPPTTGFTAVTMTNTGGNTWSASIPANDGFRVWYYILAEDQDGNFDRDPEISHGAYVYDQKNFDVCNVTPSAPTSLQAAVTGSDDVTLTWTAPTTYTNGATIDPTDTITYDVYKDGSLAATGVTSTTYSENGVTTGVHTYTVRAANSCSTPNVSADSNTAAACVGVSGQFTIDVTPTTIIQGGSYTVSIMDCAAVQPGFNTTIETINLTAGFTGFTNTSSVGSYNPQVSETGPATGTFPVTITTTGNVLDTGKLLVGATDTITVTYAPPSTTPQSKTVTVAADPCSDTPKAPSTLSGSVSGQNMTLNWSAVTLNTDNTAITDLASYRVYERVCKKGKPNCTGGDVVADWFVRGLVTAPSTSVTLSADQGKVKKRIYYFKITALDTCATPNESAFSPEWNETK